MQPLHSEMQPLCSKRSFRAAKYVPVQRNANHAAAKNIPCTAKDSSCTKCNPRAAKWSPCASKCSPCTITHNSCAAKYKPCAAKDCLGEAKCKPCAAKCTLCAATKKCSASMPRLWRARIGRPERGGSEPRPWRPPTCVLGSDQRVTETSRRRCVRDQGKVEVCCVTGPRAVLMRLKEN